MMTYSRVFMLAGMTNWLTMSSGVGELTRHRVKEKWRILMIEHMARDVKYLVT